MDNKTKILLVNSNKNQNSIISEKLQAEGYFVITVISASEAFVFLNNNAIHPDLILSNINLSDSNGFDFCIKYIQICPKTPFVLFSEYYTKEDIQKAFSFGAADFFCTKSNTFLSELTIRIENVLRINQNTLLLSKQIENLKADQEIVKTQLKDFHKIRRNSEKIYKSFKKIFYNSNDAALLISNNKFIDCNEATIKLLNAKNKKDVLSTHPSELSPPTQPDGLNSFEKADQMIKIAYKNGFHRFEWMHKKLTGEVIPIEVSLTPIGYKDELMLHALLIDLTNQKENDKKLSDISKKILRTNKKLEKTNLAITHKSQILEEALEAKSGFLATMSHEVRTPLNAIMGSARLLKEADSLEETRQYSDIIETSGNLLMGIINNVLDYSRIEAKKFNILSNQFTLENIVKNLKEILSKPAKSKNLDFDILSKNDLSLSIVGDDIKLQQILLNLCNNAIKYTQKGSVTLKIKLVQETGDNINYRFEVIDTGIGISKKNIKSLFKPFSRIHSKKTNEVEGSGLGLSIVKSTVELLGGKVGVESKPRVGSTFWVELCFKKETTKELDRRKSKSHRKNFDLQKKNLSILIADDYKFSRIILEKILKKSGFEKIDIAEDGRIAFEKYKTNNYDIIFMDCIMPHWDGFRATEEIRKYKMKDNSHTNIIALSADVMTENKSKCINSGMDFFITKPFKPERINSYIREIILGKLRQ